MATHSLDPSPIISMATAYWNSATLMAAVRLKIFDQLALGPKSSDEVAEAIGADLVATDALLVALMSLELVERTEEQTYTNATLADTFLVSGQPRSIGAALMYNADVYPLWGQLSEVIQRGDVERDPDAYLGQDQEKTRRFVYGMHHRALGVGRAVSASIDLSEATLLADIGGGPGTYSALLTQAHPKLSAEVLDLPGIVDVAQEIVENMGAKERVSCVSYDYYKDPLPDRPYDAALISGVLHREQPPQVRAIFKSVAERLPSGATLWISDVMLNDDRSGPLFSAMFALNMRVLSHDGRSHSVAEQRAWLDEAGFTVVSSFTLPPPIHYTLICAKKR
jgi:3-hydroxy-5-methyl-1-naphthoate 3-O-methyltransferase